MSMTIEEIVESMKELKAYNKNGELKTPVNEGVSMWWDGVFGKIQDCLSEIQQYRAIGTVEELKTAMKYVSLAKKHGTVGKAIDACAEYEAIGTASEFRELKEKAKAKKPKKIKRHRGGFEMEHCPNCDSDYQVDRRFEVEEDYCGNCGKLLDSSFINFCANCGCPVDMSKGKE